MSPPLNTTATVGLTKISPYYDADSDTCGDFEQNITNYRNIGGITVSSCTPGPQAIITVPCKDFNNDLVSDVGICKSCYNQASNNCSSACNNALPQGECLQCDETHPCPNNLSCNNCTCVGCIDKNDCHNTDDCIAADCVNQECVYKYLDNCKYIDDDGGFGNVSTSYMPVVPSLPNTESKIEIITTEVPEKEKILEEESNNINNQNNTNFFNCSSTASVKECFLYLILMYSVLIKKNIYIKFFCAFNLISIGIIILYY